MDDDLISRRKHGTGGKTMSEKLKPCPFCGGTVKKFIGPYKGTMLFICSKCGADVCFYGAEYEPKATEAWNRRSENA